VDIRADVRIVCFDAPTVATSAGDLHDISIQFARDVALSGDICRKIAGATGARFAVLFRPEGVSASQKVTPLPARNPVVTAVFGKQWNDRPGEVDPREKVKTTRSYTLSSALVDLRDGRVVRAAARQKEQSTQSQEAPRASEQLHQLMRDLLSDMLEQN
jgi:hypothetical protein